MNITHLRLKTGTFNVAGKGQAANRLPVYIVLGTLNNQQPCLVCRFLTSSLTDTQLAQLVEAVDSGFEAVRMFVWSMVGYYPTESGSL